jgi:hypothetical protein
MIAPSQKSLVRVFVLLIMLSLGIAAVILLRQSNAATDHSAHAALTVEICDQLAAIPPGPNYPLALSQLRLAYPDGGDASLLQLFTYQSTGTNCTVRTLLGGVEILRSYP